VSSGGVPYLCFDTAKHDGVMAKMAEFNALLASSTDATEQQCALTDAEYASLVALMAQLKGGAASAKVTAEHVGIFVGTAGRPGLLSWPASRVFPALDMLRLLVLAPSAAPFVSGLEPPLVDRLVALMAPSPSGDPPDKAISLMVQRCFANLAYATHTRKLLSAGASQALDTLATPIESGSTALRLAASTVVLNTCSILKDSALAEHSALKADALQLQALSLCAHALSVPALVQQPEEESLYRVLYALSTLLSIAAATHALALDLDLPATLQGLTLAPTAAAKVKEQQQKLLTALAAPASKH